MRDIRKDLEKRLRSLREEHECYQSQIKKLDEKIVRLQDLLEQEKKRWGNEVARSDIS